MNFMYKKINKIYFKKIFFPVFLFFLILTLFKYRLVFASSSDLVETEKDNKFKEIVLKLNKRKEKKKNNKNFNLKDDLDFQYFKRKVLDVSDNELKQDIKKNFIEFINDPEINIDDLREVSERFLNEIFEVVFKNRNELAKKFFNW
ncbi:hypothetical protein DH96_01920 [Candidatus Phytoplasma oryzae]|uniref:Uncharacterized protein n=1 Tax=Candidatus Phytoplasma oryzae TaxID=203274 RepID=A0A328IHC0_9MOLU|nr:hypothetical protein [Candidatus Phytoplasma oryzae]RAM57689.1 hypothetical protein DH96_01920 [Candidatus Phytoplasma oryzae]